MKPAFIKPAYNGPTGHEVEPPVESKIPAGMSRAKHVALREIRKLALQEGIDLTMVDPSDSGDAPDADADEFSGPPFRREQ